MPRTENPDTPPRNDRSEVIAAPERTAEDATTAEEFVKLMQDEIRFIDSRERYERAHRNFFERMVDRFVPIGL
jgi:hypothetical protein